MDMMTYDVVKKGIVKAGEFRNSVFVKEVTSRHFMKMLQAYGVQEDVIWKLKELSCVKVRIVTPTSILESDFSEWLKPDIKVADYGHGKQRFMPINRMRNVPPVGQAELPF